MTLSGWARIWIVAAALAGCSAKQEGPTITPARIAQFKNACKDFQYKVRKTWELSASDPMEERAAIEKMRDACTEFERELFEQGIPVF